MNASTQGRPPIGRSLRLAIVIEAVFVAIALADAGGPSGFEPGGLPVPAEACVCSGPCPDEESPIRNLYGFSGEFHLSCEDLRVRSVGFDFVWARKYRSRLGPVTAQGNGWDFSYNAQIQQAGPDAIVLFDGNTRADVYCRQPDGVTFARDEFFREGQFQPDGTFVLTFSDTSSWTFLPLDGSPQAGKLAQIADRNGNAMSFQYDPAGRLTTVIDTLGRPYTIDYDPDGFIVGVNDFAGRSVTYEYYENGDAGGSSGDLKSVTTPAVVDSPEFPIPPGHEFPSGKTTVYTYATGFADEDLNHNLLTITDPLGQTFLVNVYAPTTNPGDFDFDRLARQTLGDPGDVFDHVYVPVTPAPGNNDAVIRLIVNDPVGNVSEFFYDDQNRHVMTRDFTGRADPDNPTTGSSNRPAGKLRPGDPDFFETRFEYNADALVTEVLFPEGSSTLNVYELDLDPMAPRRSRGNLRERHEMPGPRGGDQSVIVETFEYDDGMGGCCGTNFVTRHVDGRGNETLHEYDAAGNRTRTTHPIPSLVEDFEYDAFGRLTKHTHAADDGDRRVDRFVYYGPGDGHQNGYLRDRIVDDGGFHLVTTFEYDPAGNVVREIDPKGNDTFFLVNQLNQVIQEISREPNPGDGVRYDETTFYDANDNVVRVETVNIDDSGQVVGSNPSFTTIFEYDILNRTTRVSEEIDPSSDLATEYEYDANRNRTLLRKGEAVNGNDPENVVATLYDERDLVFTVTRGEGSAEASTTQLDYDGNRNLVREIEGTEDPTPAETLHLHDGYDRKIRTTDPMGNDTVQSYDANDNLVVLRIEGEIDDQPGSASNVRLQETLYEYDALDRQIRERELHFDPATQTPVGDGESETRHEYESRGLLVRTILDDAREIRIEYDSAHRVSSITDGEGNIRLFAHDSNSNVVSVTAVDLSDLGRPDDVLVNSFEYDGLDRLTAVEIDDGSLSSRLTYAYDSRDNRVVEMDARRPTVGDPGNETRHTYDGLDRRVATETILTDNGTGTGSPAGSIRIQKEWDDSMRLVACTDDEGNTTAYEYDALDRWTRATFADGTTQTTSYDRRDNPVTLTDARGSVITTTYDLLDRPAMSTLIPGAVVSADTTLEVWQYDGLSRITRAEDDDSIVTRVWDSLYMQQEAQNGAVVATTRDGLGRPLQIIYPGGRVVTTTWNRVDNPTAIDPGGGAEMIDYDYLGPRRVERRQHGSSLRMDYSYDGLRRLAGTTTTRDPLGSAQVVDVRAYTWDGMGNRVSRQDLTPGTAQPRHDFEYDSQQRLVRSTSQSLVEGPGAVDYTLDGTHDRTAVTGGPDAGPYTMDPVLPEPADAQVHQYSKTPFDLRSYDRGGNLRRATALDGSREMRMRYDARNRLVEIEVRTVASGPGGPGGVTSGTVAVERSTYAYDPFDRRIRKTVDVDGTPEETRFVYDGWRVIEERDDQGATTASYVWGQGLDEILVMARDGRDHLFVTDDQYDVLAVTDGSGRVLERYEYDDFGRPRVDRGPGSLGGPLRSPYLFAGRRFDAESGLYYYRTRYYEPRTGTFLSRDPLGVWGDRTSLGNPRAYVGHNPWSRVDPMGRESVQDQLLQVLEEKSVEKVKEGLKKLADKGLLPPGFADYAEVLYKAAKASIAAAEGLAIRLAVRMDIDSKAGKRTGFVRRGDDFFRYIVIGTGTPGECELIVQRLEEVCVRRNLIGWCVETALRWRTYKTYEVDCCNYGGRF